MKTLHLSIMITSLCILSFTSFHSVDSMYEKRQDCKTGMVCFIPSDFIKYSFYHDQKLWWVKTFSYLSPLDDHTMEVNVTDESKKGDVLLGSDWWATNSSQSREHVSLMTGISDEEIVGAHTCCYTFTYLMPSPVEKNSWLKLANTSYLNSKISKDNYNWNGYERSVVVINDKNIKQIVDKQTGILLLLENHNANPVYRVSTIRLTDTNIIQTSNVFTNASNVVSNVAVNATSNESRYTSPTLEHSFLFPHQQFESGIAAMNIKCLQDLQLIIKAEDGSPDCVKSKDVVKLEERGWAK